jgi:hypothetical protein
MKKFFFNFLIKILLKLLKIFSLFKNLKKKKIFIFFSFYNRIEENFKEIRDLHNIPFFY